MPRIHAAGNDSSVVPLDPLMEAGAGVRRPSAAAMRTVETHCTGHRKGENGVFVRLGDGIIGPL